MADQNDIIPKASPDATEALIGSVPLDHRYVNVRPEMLARTMAQDRTTYGTFAESARALLDAMVLVLDMETAALRQALDREYAHFNPDSVDPLQPLDGAKRQDRSEDLCKTFRYVFEKANFTRLNDVQIEEAINAANSQGLRVRLDPDAIEHLDLFVRGVGCIERTFQHWKSPVKGVVRELAIYRRLGVVMRLKESEHILLKMFRDIPVADIEALLPHAQIQMSWVDRAKVACGGFGAFGGLAMKVVKGGALLAPTSLMIPAAVALGGLSFKSFMGYRRAKQFRVSQRIFHLYHQNLASNAAVLHTLLAFVTQQEISEAFLLYAHLASERSAHTSSSRNTETVRGDIETWLHERFEAKVRFEIEDALETLDRLDLWADRARLRVIPAGEAIERLRDHAIHRKSADYHMRTCDRQQLKKQSPSAQEQDRESTIAARRRA